MTSKHYFMFSNRTVPVHCRSTALQSTTATESHLPDVNDTEWAMPLFELPGGAVETTVQLL